MTNSVEGSIEPAFKLCSLSCKSSLVLPCWYPQTLVELLPIYEQLPLAPVGWQLGCLGLTAAAAGDGLRCRGYSTGMAATTGRYWLLVVVAAAAVVAVAGVAVAAAAQVAAAASSLKAVAQEQEEEEVAAADEDLVQNCVGSTKERLPLLFGPALGRTYHPTQQLAG